MGKLTARKAQTAEPGKHEDGDGLRLVVSATGGRKWVLRVTLDGRRREMGLGGFPEVSLAEARAKAAEARAQARAGQDPIAARKVEPETVPTFATCAAGYIEAHAPSWKNPKHVAQWSATLRTYADPFVGTKPVDRVGTDDVLRILQPIWTAKTETAKRVQGRIENILDWAIARKYRAGENPARWRGHLDKLLARPSQVRTVTHRPAMPYGEVPAFMGELAKLNSVSAMALRFLILTATRTGEVLGATWSELDLEAATWTVPGARMKAKHAHRVPLANAALEVLEALPRIEGNPYLFFGARYGRPLSNMALLQLMRGIGYGVGGDRGDYVPHGFRSSFRDWAGEVSPFPRDVCEMALAHVVENKVEAAYRRGDLFEKRRSLMTAWADWCTAPAARNVVRMRRAGN